MWHIKMHVVYVQHECRLIVYMSGEILFELAVLQIITMVDV